MGFQKDRRRKAANSANVKATIESFQRAEWQGFLPCVLTAEDKAQLDPDKLMDNYGNVADLGQFVDQNYKITFSLDQYPFPVNH